MSADDIKSIVAELRAIESTSREQVTNGARSQDEHENIMQHIVAMRRRILDYVTTATEDAKQLVDEDMARLRESNECKLIVS